MYQSTRSHEASDFHPEALHLFDQFVHGLLTRHAFLELALPFVGRHGSPQALLAALSPDFARGQQIDANDARLSATRTDFPSRAGRGHASLVRPRNAGRALPVVVVLHENRGLNPHIEDVTRRLALRGFIALAPDALHPLGGYPGDEDRARELFAQLDRSKVLEDFVAAVEFASRLPGGNGRLGAVGFCFGGGMAHQLAHSDRVHAVVPFYGSAPPPEFAANVRAELLVHFAENDERVNATWPAYEAALLAAKVAHRVHYYAGTQHGFHNDTTPRFDEVAAALAWQRTLEFFERVLRNPGAPANVTRA